MVAGKAVYHMPAAGFAARIPELLQAGATFVGGCCGSTPEFIAAMSRIPA